MIKNVLTIIVKQDVKSVKVVVFVSIIVINITARTVVEKEYVFTENKENNVRTAEVLKYVNTKGRDIIAKSVS